MCEIHLKYIYVGWVRIFRWFLRVGVVMCRWVTRLATKGPQSPWHYCFRLLPIVLKTGRRLAGLQHTQGFRMLHRQFRCCTVSSERKISVASDLGPRPMDAHGPIQHPLGIHGGPPPPRRPLGSRSPSTAPPADGPPIQPPGKRDPTGPRWAAPECFCMRKGDVVNLDMHKGSPRRVVEFAHAQCRCPHCMRGRP